MMETKSVTICGHCGMEQPLHSQYCFKCGTKIGKMTCGACGATLPNGCRFCMGCGARLGENGKRLYKVTFEYKAELDGFFAPCTVIIDQEKQEVLAYGYILEIYLTEGKHEIEIRRIGEAEYQNRIIVEKDTYITVKTVPLSFRKIEVIIQ